MRRVVQRLGIGFGVLVALLLIASGGLAIAGSIRLHRTRVVDPDAIAIPTDSASLARGRHLANAICADCHGTALTGAPVFQEPALGAVYAANITGLGATHSDVDLVRAIRHAVAPDGHELAIMPADAFIYFSREDLGAVIAYLKTVERTGTDQPRPHFTLLARILYGAHLLPNLYQADVIDHRMPFPPMPNVGANLATGEYLSRFCYGCHGEDLHGGKSPDPAAPPVPDLAVVRRWSEEDFETFARSGGTPEGRYVNPQFMPWQFFTKLDPDERRALYLYLHATPEERSHNATTDSHTGGAR